mmetsp:Transcript_39817/g.79595  ORF Transcript_39817/g.79595 Transcript_39817/m.79595 type:complete len:86 (+) Transcript_39817:485-742(+)|eukprot:CAMPEP_0174719516 /NCGR_PEP_ID=MMETSP1094-20130205/31297_1 /TAXON_ID=156173 /ORGANISM="Chrysochromulina brevifilum, Strain UTEX LB 985" /LENGTH=85 /DNA_ID=CAMNT_0015919825 /DNA_START=478 /DNA_END=735 /DNA_ORIENTATION=+
MWGLQVYKGGGLPLQQLGLVAAAAEGEGAEGVAAEGAAAEGVAAAAVCGTATAAATLGSCAALAVSSERKCSNGSLAFLIASAIV